MDEQQLKNIVEAALMTAGRSLEIDTLIGLFAQDDQPGRDAVHKVLEAIDQDCEGRALELTRTGSGYRLQVRQGFAPWVSRLWEERPPRYSRALMETLALVAYRQPITRGEIEDVRGVAVSSSIVRTMLEREWIRVVGHRDVPGRPALYGTTRQFLDYFNLKSLEELPTLAEIRDLDSLHRELELQLAPGEDDMQEGPGIESGDETARQEVATLGEDESASQSAAAVTEMEPAGPVH